MSQRARNSLPKSGSYILISDGFDEFEVVSILHTFRQSGLRIQSVSLFDRLVTGYLGVRLRADCTLADDLLDLLGDYLLILPTRGRNGEALRHDARIKTLLERVNQSNGRVAITDNQSNLADDVTRLMQDRVYQPESGQEFDEFVRLLADRLATAAS